MKKKAIVSFANKRGNYLIAIERLKESLKSKEFNANFIGIIGEEMIGSPKHIENPYAFKIYCIEKALSEGYEQILYLDSSIFAVRELTPLWKVIDENGYFMIEAGFMVGQWCNDETLNYFHLSRVDAMQMKMYGNCGVLGLDFTTQIAQTFFSSWKQSMLDGMFKGSWDNHRHDMTCGSIIANRLNMKMERGDQWLSYALPDSPTKDETIIFHGSGL